MLHRADVAPVIAYLDTDIIIRHLTGDPPEQAAHAWLTPTQGADPSPNPGPFWVHPCCR